MYPSASDPMAGIPDLGDGRFQLVERIGAGGMGTVYRAIQRSVGRSVAIKVLAPQQASNASGVARFVREANVISRLAHPNIVSVIDFGRDRAGNLLMVMELLDGEPLRQTMRRAKRLPVSRAIGVAHQVLAGLRVAHGAGIVHRDLKPENIFMCRVDGADLVKVLDFGVAKLVSSDAGEETTAGSLVGTARYMAPEQIAGDPPDSRVDLHAVGVVLYEMLTGTLPYNSKERLQLLRAILNDPPEPLTTRAPDLPAELSDVVMRAIAKSPAARFQTADEFRVAIAPFAQMHITAGGATTAIDLAPPEPDPSDAAERKVSGPRPLLDPPSGSASGARPSPGTNALARDGGRVDFTTSAGLSSDSRRVEPSRAGTLKIAVGVTLGLIALGSSVGLLLGREKRRGHGATTATTDTTHASATTNPQGAPEQPANTVAPATPVTAATIVLRTTPDGASVLDTASGTVLCTTTPCAVSVLAGQPRRVTLALGAVTMQTLLEPGLSPVTIDLQPSGSPPAPEPMPAPEPAAANGPEVSPGAPQSHRRPHGGHGGANVQMFGNPPIQMFGTTR